MAPNEESQGEGLFGVDGAEMMWNLSNKNNINKKCNPLHLNDTSVF